MYLNLGVALGVAVTALQICGCASGSLSRFNSDGSLPKDLPKDLREKFAVKETQNPPYPGSAGADAHAVAGIADHLDSPPGSSTSSSRMASAGSKALHDKPGKRHPHLASGKEKPVNSANPAPAAKDDVVEAAKPSFVYPHRRPEKEPIWPGEKHVYSITYFGVSAGDFSLEVLPDKVINNRKVYHFLGTATSSKVFSLFYRLNDSVETFIDREGMFSHRFHLVLDETKQTRDAVELNDSEKAQTYYWSRWNHQVRGFEEKKEFAAIEPFSQDSLSALIYLRTIPLPTGAVITFPVVSEGKSWEAVVTVVRREMVSSPLGRVQAVVLKPETRFRGVLQKTGDSYLWLTDDDRRFVLRLEAKVKIGTVVADLKKLEIGTAPETANSALVK